MTFVALTVGRLFERVVEFVFTTDSEYPRLLKKWSISSDLLEKVKLITTQMSKSEEVRKWNGVFNMGGVRRRVQQITMGVCRFVVHNS